ncbi:MAG TPA: efflux RND transporter periplasmic adaptor subunit [Chthoniobacteraceae bacterium]|nr:efflux RND transporter periplasmic adaptor subunit [Chthoniobacteraceae bacterium]
MKFNKAIVLYRIALSAILATPLLLLGGCGRGNAQEQQAAPPPPAVTVAPVEQKEITEWSDFTGRTDAVESVEIRPRVSGHITQVCFQAGQLVKKGDVLFVIDPQWYQAEFDRRSADYEQAQARVENSKRNADRNARLLASKTVSNETADDADTQLKADQAAMLSAKALMESAKLDLDYTQVRAPVDGRMSRALLTTGNYVSGVAGYSTLLTTLVSVDPVYVYADVDENSLLQFNALAAQRKDAGDATIPVELQLANEEGFPHKGHIESFDNRLDPNTGTILLRAVFQNPDGLIVPGLFAHIRIPMSAKHEAVLVDEASIGTDQAQKFVLTVDKDNTVQYRKVILGPEIDGKRIVRDGLKAGELIVVNGIQRAHPGGKVSPEEQVADTARTQTQTAQR